MSRRLRRTRRVAGGMALLAASTLVLPGVGSGAQSFGGFVAAAVADGGRVTFTVPGFAAVEEIIDGGGAVSQSVLDPQGAVSFASLPHPGELAIAGPGLFNAVTGQNLPGGYPFYVQASHPTDPEQELAGPGGAYRLAARAAQHQTDALSQFRSEGTSGGAGGTRSTTSAAMEGETVTVTAQTVNEALNAAGGALRIASVRSRSVTTYRAGADAPVSTTELVIEGGSAAGHSFSFGPDGLVVAGHGVPIPAASGLAQLNTALEPVGIALRFADAQPVVGGATAGAFEIRLAGQAPIPGTPPGIIRLRFGGASTSVVTGEGAPGLLPPIVGAAGPSEEVVAPPAAADPGPGSGPDGAPSAPARPVRLPNGAPPGAPAGVSNLGPDLLAGSVPAASPAAGTPSGNDPSGGRPVSGLAQPTLVPRDLGSDGFIFGTVMVAAVVILALSVLWRAKGLLPS